MMRFRLLASLLLAFGVADAQDLTRLFLPGDPAFQLMGGNPLSIIEADAGSGLFVRYDSRFDDYYREYANAGSSPSLGGTMHSVQAGVAFPSGSTFHLLAQTEELTSRARNSGDQLLDYSNNRKFLRLSYGMPLGRGLRWTASLGHSDASGSALQDVGTSVSFSLPHSALSIGLERTTNAQQLGIIVSSIRGTLPLDHQNIISRVALTTGSESVRFSLAASQTVVSPHNDQSHPDGLRFEPAGFVRQWQSRMEAGLAESWKMVITAEGSVVEGRGSFTANGSGYGMLERAYYHETTVSGGLVRESEQLLLVGDLSWTRINGALNGRVDSWPFVSALVSPFSQRANFEIEGSFRLLKAHAGAVVPLADWFNLGGGISVLRLLPDLRIESWQGGLLGIGRKAYTDRRLSVEQLDGGMVSAGFQLKLGDVRIDYSANQFVPISLQKSSPPSGTAGMLEIFPAPQAGAAARSSGGLFQKLSVKWGM